MPGDQIRAQGAPARLASFGLLSLPLELLEWTTAFLNSDGFFNLRLSSKGLASILVDAFSRRYVQKRVVSLLDRDGLNNLVRVLKDERYGRKITIIEFSTLCLHDPNDVELGGNEWLAINYNEIRADEGGHPAVFALLEAWKTQQRFERSMPHHLIRLFKLLQTKQLFPAITIALSSNRHDGSRTKLRFEKLTSNVSEAGIKTFNAELEDYYAAPAISEAIVKAQYYVEHISLGEYVDIEDLRTAYCLRPEENAFENLRRLELNLRWFGPRGRPSRVKSGSAGRTWRIQCIHWLTCVPVHLEHLKIEIMKDHDAEKTICDGILFQEIAADVERNLKDTGEAFPPLSELRHLDLTGHDIPKAALLDFVRERRKTLRFLRLRAIMDGDHDHPDIQSAIFRASGCGNFKLNIASTYNSEGLAALNAFARKRNFAEFMGDAPPPPFEDGARWLTASEAGIAL